MGYSILHISFLLDLLLIKEQLPRNREGLVKLLQIVEDEVDNESERSEKQYLYKLNLRIQEAIELQKETIKIKSTCLANCITHFKYASFKDLIIKIDQIKDLVDETLKGSKKVLLLLPDSGINRIKEEIELAQNEVQNFKFLEKQYRLDNWQDLLLSQSPKRAIIWFINSEICVDNQVLLHQFFQNYQDKLTRIIPFFLVSKPSELVKARENLNTQNLIGGSDDLLILIQLLIAYKFDDRLNKLKNLDTISNISIKDSNTVVLLNKAELMLENQ
jgi:hypothetical protein